MASYLHVYVYSKWTNLWTHVMTPALCWLRSSLLRSSRHSPSSPPLCATCWERRLLQGSRWWLRHRSSQRPRPGAWTNWASSPGESPLPLPSPLQTPLLTGIRVPLTFKHNILCVWRVRLEWFVYGYRQNPFFSYKGHMMHYHLDIIMDIDYGLLDAHMNWELLNV